MSVDVSAVGLALGLDVISPSPAYGGVAEANFSVGAKGEIHTDPAELSESSSIGVPDDSDDDDGEGEVESKPSGSLSSLASLEESLPIKRGLSSHFMGKSKSFGNLSEVKTVKEMAKRENPLNKRRRTMIAYKWSKNRSSLFGCRGNPTSIPLLSLNEDEEDEDEDDEDARRQHLKSSKSCFSLTDLRK